MYLRSLMTDARSSSENLTHSQKRVPGNHTVLEIACKLPSRRASAIRPQAFSDIARTLAIEREIEQKCQME